MLIAYQDIHLRDCCLLLKPASLNSSFSPDEIKNIRSYIADLKSAPKLSDCPFSYTRNTNSKVIEISSNHIKLVCRIVSTLEKPRDEEVERLLIVKIINTQLQIELKSKTN